MNLRNCGWASLSHFKNIRGVTAGGKDVYLGTGGKAPRAGQDGAHPGWWTDPAGPKVATTVGGPGKLLAVSSKHETAAIERGKLAVLVQNGRHTHIVAMLDDIDHKLMQPRVSGAAVQTYSWYRWVLVLACHSLTTVPKPKSAYWFMPGGRYAQYANSVHAQNTDYLKAIWQAFSSTPGNLLHQGSWVLPPSPGPILSTEDNA